MLCQNKNDTVEAIKWVGNTAHDVPIWFSDALRMNKNDVGSIHTFYSDLYVHTPKGVRICNPGDYIVRLPNGTLLAVWAVVFENVWETL